MLPPRWKFLSLYLYILFKSKYAKIIILQLQCVALPFIEKKGPYSWQSPLVLQQQFLLYSLVTDLQCYSGSHAPSPKGWAMIHLKPIKETPLLLTSGVCPTSVHVPYFWPNRHKGGFFCDTEKKKKMQGQRSLILCPPFLFCVEKWCPEVWQASCNKSMKEY